MVFVCSVTYALHCISIDETATAHPSIHPSGYSGSVTVNIIDILIHIVILICLINLMVTIIDSVTSRCFAATPVRGLTGKAA